MNFSSPKAGGFIGPIMSACKLELGNDASRSVLVGSMTLWHLFRAQSKQVDCEFFKI